MAINIERIKVDELAKKFNIDDKNLENIFIFKYIQTISNHPNFQKNIKELEKQVQDELNQEKKERADEYLKSTRKFSDFLNKNPDFIEILEIIDFGDMFKFNPEEALLNDFKSISDGTIDNQIQKLYDRGAFSSKFIQENFSFSEEFANKFLNKIRGINKLKKDMGTNSQWTDYNGINFVRELEPLQYANSYIKSLIIVNKFNDDYHKGIVSDMDLILNEEEEARVIHLEKESIPILLATDNSIFFREMPFNYFFINNDIRFSDLGATVKGIFGINNEKTPHKNKDIGIMILYVLDDSMAGFYDSFSFNTIENHQFTKLSKEEEKLAMKIRKRISNFICNFLDMLTEKSEVEVIEVDYKTNNLKRIKRGKPRICNKVYVRISGKLKQYIHNFNSDSKRYGYSHKFLVRGHYRHFKSERYHEGVIGMKKWIKPFYKGVGIILKKPYEIEIEKKDLNT